jgi:hypothetical protein
MKDFLLQALQNIPITLFLYQEKKLGGQKSAEI